MLADLLEVLQTLLLVFHDGTHASQGSSLQLFTAVKRIGEFEESDIVLRNIVD